MANDFLDLVQWHKSKNDKTYTVRIGYGTMSKTGTGANMVFQALPIAGPDGLIKVSLVPRREQASRMPPRTTTTRNDLQDDESIPF